MTTDAAREAFNLLFTNGGPLYCVSLTEEEMEARDTLSAALDQMAWKPIETAPKDDARILLLSPTGVYIGVRKMFFEKTGRYEIFRDDVNAPGHTWSCEPTHWRELPTPPGTHP